MFITFEGIDGSGTTMHAGLCAQALGELGRRVCEGSEPNIAFETGKRLRRILAGEERLPPLELQRLFLQNRREDILGCINHALHAGVDCIWDRYDDSTNAYGMLTHSLEEIDAVRREVIGDVMVVPDLTFLLDVPVEIGLRRKFGTKNEIFDRHYTQTRVRANYTKLAVWCPNRIVTVNTEAEVETVHAQIMAVVRERFGL